MKVTVVSAFTGKKNTIDLNITEAQLREFESPRGRHIHEIFPDLAPWEREFLKTGVTPEEWAECLPPEDDELDEEFYSE